MSSLPCLKSSPSKSTPLILIIGKSGAGKSSLLARLQKNTKAKIENIQPTGDSPTSLIWNKMEFIDLSGTKMSRGLWSVYYNSVKGVIYVLDGTLDDSKTNKELQNIVAPLLEEEELLDNPIALVVNKMDLIDKKIETAPKAKSEVSKRKINKKDEIKKEDQNEEKKDDFSQDENPENISYEIKTDQESKLGDGENSQVGCYRLVEQMLAKLATEKSNQQDSHHFPVTQNLESDDIKEDASIKDAKEEMKTLDPAIESTESPKDAAAAAKLDDAVDQVADQIHDVEMAITFKQKKKPGSKLSGKKKEDKESSKNQPGGKKSNLSKNQDLEDKKTSEVTKKETTSSSTNRIKLFKCSANDRNSFLDVIKWIQLFLKQDGKK